VTAEAIKKAKQARVNLDFNRFESYVHVSATLMEKLDKVYLEHFREVEDFTLLDCFDIYKDNHRGLFMKYLDDVLEVLNVEKNGLGSRSAQDPAVYGVVGAVSRLKHMFLPLQGRICLPLATVSMLDDLRKFVLMDGNVIPQVRGRLSLT
jgi:hypothetical protein